MSRSVILACDLGGSSFRAALIDQDGAVVARHAVGIASGDASEADPALWWASFAGAAKALLGGADVGVAAIAVSAFTRTQVLADTAGAPRRPAILWRDARAAAIAEELKALCPADHPEAREINAFHPLARLAWLRRHEPVAVAPGTLVLEPKDWLNLRLTGVAASDPVSMARLHAARGLFPVMGLDAAMLPPLRPPVSIVGQARPGLGGALERLAGVPVVAMANDTWASVVGLGAMRPGLAYNLSGTTEVLGVVAAAEAGAPGLLTVDWSGGAGALWQLGGPSQSGGDTLVWLTELLGGGAGGAGAVGAELDRLFAAGNGGEPLLFLPYLQGERTPFWDPALRGAFVGLSRRHGPADLALAALEGVAFLNRLVLERAEAATGRRAAEIRFGGGGAANPRWRRIKADVLGRTVATVAGDDHGLAGAAITAWTALGRYGDLAAAQDSLVVVTERTAPQDNNIAHYDRLYGLFLEAGEALAPISRRLGAG